MGRLLAIILVFAAIFSVTQGEASASPVGAVFKHLSSLLQWWVFPSIFRNGRNSLRFEKGYFVETIVERNGLGFHPYTVAVSEGGDVFAVDPANNNVVRITPPLSQHSRARLVAGSFRGYAGLVDGEPSKARFNNPKGLTMDERGNIYIADTSNHVIRKIGERGVTTIAGGKSHVAGYQDGSGRDAKFSSDFDVVYVGKTCSLLVIDRGNAALRKISLHREDCTSEYSSMSMKDVIMVVSAVLGLLIGYATHSCRHPLLPNAKLHLEPKWQDSITTGELLQLQGKRYTPPQDQLAMPENRTDPSILGREQMSSFLLNTSSTSNLNSFNPHEKGRPPTHRGSSSRYGSPPLDQQSPDEAPQVSSKRLRERSRLLRHDRSGDVALQPVEGELKPVRRNKPRERFEL